MARDHQSACLGIYRSTRQWLFPRWPVSFRSVGADYCQKSHKDYKKESPRDVMARFDILHVLELLRKVKELLKKLKLTAMTSQQSSLVLSQQKCSVLQGKQKFRDAFCQFPFRLIYYYGSNNSTGKETSKMHLFAKSC